MQRRVLITGGSSGLGLALGLALARRGDAVALVARDPAKLQRAKASIHEIVPEARVLTLAADVRDPGSVRSCFSTLATELGGLDALVNSAGVLKEGYFETLSPEAHREVMETNYFGTLGAIREALPYLKASGHGRIVNVASVAGLTGVFGYTAYCAAKHALVGLTDALRYELSPQGIVVQLVCPGEFDSPMVDELERYRTPENRVHTLTIPKVGVDVVVRATVRAMERDDFLIVPGVRARLAVFGLRHFPAMSRSVGSTQIRKRYVGPNLGARGQDGQPALPADADGTREGRRR